MSCSRQDTSGQLASARLGQKDFEHFSQLVLVRNDYFTHKRFAMGRIFVSDS
jgi:hypothetical protein